MHDTPLGSHAPPPSPSNPKPGPIYFNKPEQGPWAQGPNQLPMATEPHDFLHIKEVEDGKKLVVFEEGADNLNISTTTEFQKYFGKKQAWMYIGYNHGVDLKNDDFLNSLGQEEKKGFDEEMKKIWAKRAPLLHKEDMWYMILEGVKNGEKKVGLYQDEHVFKKARDEDFIANTKAHEEGWGWSLKGCWFEDLASAKNYIQMARDEEGVHWGWPKKIPVIWKKGPLTQNDIENFPGFQSEEEF